MPNLLHIAVIIKPARIAINLHSCTTSTCVFCVSWFYSSIAIAKVSSRSDGLTTSYVGLALALKHTLKETQSSQLLGSTKCSECQLAFLVVL
jgi:hypothetical protein